jgi:hypothetical protein
VPSNFILLSEIQELVDLRNWIACYNPCIRKLVTDSSLGSSLMVMFSCVYSILLAV